MGITSEWDPQEWPVTAIPRYIPAVRILPPVPANITYACTNITTPIPASVTSDSACRNDRHNIHQKIHHYVMIPVVVLIIGINVFILAHALKRRYFRRLGHWFIASLCVADLLVGGASIENIITQDKVKTKTHCLIHMGLNISAIVASILFLLAIAVDRFLSITRALEYTKLVTSRRAAIVICCIFLASVTVGFIPLTGWNNESYNGYCSFMYVQDPDYIVVLLTGSLVPIFTIFVIYIRLYYMARRHLKKIQALDALTQSNLCVRAHGWSSRGWRCFSRLVAMVGCVLITWSPFIVASLWDIAASDTPCWLKNVIGTHFLVLGMTNSILNPLVYTISTRDFRQIWTNYFSKNLCSSEEQTST